MEFVVTAEIIKGSMALAALTTWLLWFIGPKPPKSWPGWEFLYLAIDIVCGMFAGAVYLFLETLT